MFFWVVFVFVVIHFLKDITQDILRISTPLDLLGNVNEDLSRFPVVIRQAYVSLGHTSYVAETFLLFAIPLVATDKKKTRLAKFVWLTILLLSLYLLSAVLLDPKFGLTS